VSDIVTLTPNPALDVSTSVARVRPTHKLRCSTAQRDPGGGGINVARVVRRLGGEVVAVYPAGGPPGEMLRQLIAAENIKSRVIATEEETRENFSVHEEETGDQYRFVLPGVRLGETEWLNLCRALGDLEVGARFVVASGSLPPGAPMTFYAHAARMGKEAGARVVLDTSGDALKFALGGDIYLVKPNLRELSDLIGAPVETRAAQLDACRTLIAQGKAEAIALTLGEEGALFVTADAAFAARPPGVEAVSAVGAGDSFLGGLVLKLRNGAGPDEALRYGVACGTAALISPGTELCRPEDVVSLLPGVRVEPA
jgi:6-phosphofructokinase 2